MKSISSPPQNSHLRRPGAAPGLLPAQGSRHAAAAEPLLRPTPLVLKDGRIANVSIHVLRFAAGRAELAAEPANIWPS